MRENSGDGQDAAKERLSAAYREAVASVMAARTYYDQTVAADGADSRGAKQAEDSPKHRIEQRNQLRAEYALAIGR